MEKLDNFCSLIFAYNNVTHSEFNNTLHKCPKGNEKLQINYIKVKLIEKILSISGDYLDINYSGECKKLYNKEYGLMIMNNRKNVIHNKSSKLFVIDLLSHIKQNLPLHCHNEAIIDIFDLCTVPI